MNIALNDINLKLTYGNSIHRNLYSYYCNPYGWCNRNCCRAQTGNGKTGSGNFFKKNIPNPYRSIKFSALLISVALGVIAGGILENTGAFYEADMGYFASIFIFGGFALLIASLYINNRLSPKNL